MTPAKDYFADLDTDPFASSDVSIRANAHIVNGGDASFDCPKCKGSGVFRGYARTFSCYGCRGKGKVSKAVVAAAKGKVTRAENLATKRAEFMGEHSDLVAALHSVREWNTFAASMLDAIETYGSLTENQMAACERMLAKVAATREAKRAERNAEVAVKSGTVGVDAINALFETAIDNGLKSPIFRTEFLTIKPAKRHAGVLYVTDSRIGGEYVGKIVNGKFDARREAKPGTLNLLCEIAADPLKTATDYGRSTGTCGCCGRELTDPISVANGIGPICQSKWGL